MSKRHIDDVFKQALENHEISPPFKNWDGIQHHLPRPKPFYFQTAFKVSLAAFFLMVAGIGSLTIRQNLLVPDENHLVSNNTNSDQTISPKAKPDNPTGEESLWAVSEVNQSNQLSKTQNSNPNSLNINTISNKTNTLNQFSNPSVGTTKVPVKTSKYSKKANSGLKQVGNVAKSPDLKSNEISKSHQSNVLTNINSGKDLAIATDQVKSGNIAPALENDSQTDNDRLESLPKSELSQVYEPNNAKHNVINSVGLIGKPKKNKTNGLYFGSFYGVHVSRLLNNQALNATKNVEDLKYRMHSGNSYGFISGYDFSLNWGIQTEWTVRSTQGQLISYKPLESVTYRETQINLTYTNIPLLVKYRFTRTAKLTKQPTTLNVLAGIQYGILKSAEINLNNPTIHTNLLKKSTWGLVTGVDYDLYLSRNYFLSFGARAAFSTSSDSFAKVEIPDKNSANHLLLGLRASFNYRFVR